MGNVLKKARVEDKRGRIGGALNSVLGIRPRDLRCVDDDYTFVVDGKDKFIRVINMDMRKHVQVANYFDIVEKKRGLVYKLKPFYTFAGLYHFTDVIIVKVQKITSSYLVREREWEVDTPTWSLTNANREATVANGAKFFALP